MKVLVLIIGVCLLTTVMCGPHPYGFKKVEKEEVKVEVKEEKEEKKEEPKYQKEVKEEKAVKEEKVEKKEEKEEKKEEPKDQKEVKEEKEVKEVEVKQEEPKYPPHPQYYHPYYYPQPSYYHMGPYKRDTSEVFGWILVRGEPVGFESHPASTTPEPVLPTGSNVTGNGTGSDGTGDKGSANGTGSDGTGDKDTGSDGTGDKGTGNGTGSDGTGSGQTMTTPQHAGQHKNRRQVFDDTNESNGGDNSDGGAEEPVPTVFPIAKDGDMPTSPLMEEEEAKSGTVPQQAPLGFPNDS